MAGTQRDLASCDLWLRSLARSYARRGMDHPVTTPTARDLADARLWHASRDRSEGATPRAATGVAGTSVAAVQQRLGVTADGIAGPQTRAAITSFQGAHGLPATGRLDDATRTAILQSDATAAPKPSTAAG